MSREALEEAGLALLTPEQVPVHFRVGDAGARLGALVMDGLLLLVAALLPLLGASFALPALGGLGEVGWTAFLVLFFALRTFYFPFFELRWQGRTPGKRKMGLRVVARDGGPLTAEMVFARNLTRELEVFLPISVLLAGPLPGVPAWASLSSLVWALVLAAVPLANRQRLRLGDLVAGTVVVADPRPELLEDLAHLAHRSHAADDYTFSREQLEIYGIKELEVLEELLRRPASRHTERLLVRVAETVQEKVGWESPDGRPVQAERFLRAFYAAQRGRLERGLLVGERREEKVR